MAVTTIDFAPLTTPVPEAEVAAWKKLAKASRAAWATWQVSNIIAVVAIVPFVIIMFVVVFGFGTIAFDRISGPGDLRSLIFPIAVLVVVVAIIAVGIVRGVGSFGRRWELWARMDKFARANGMTFSPLDGNPSYPGAIFQIGDTRQAVDHLRSADGRFFDLGNFRYTTGSGKSRSTRTWGFLAFHLDRKLPNMVLDSKANNGFFGTNLPATFDKNQVLSLEGDFDKYFTLYCPKQYEPDALYVFTPDLMALLIDEAAPFDVEIIDDWMFVYSNTAFVTGDPATYARLFRIMDTVGSKTLTQTDRYVDEHVGDFTANFVAPQGARLKRRVSAGALVVVVLFVILWLSGVLGDAVHSLTGLTP
jgi:hypothetical protein